MADLVNQPHISHTLLDATHCSAGEVSDVLNKRIEGSSIGDVADNGKDGGDCGYSRRRDATSSLHTIWGRVSFRRMIVLGHANLRQLASMSSLVYHGRSICGS